VVDPTPGRQNHRSNGRDPDLPAVAMAGKLQVDRGESNQGGEIIGFVYNPARRCQAKQIYVDSKVEVSETRGIGFARSSSLVFHPVYQHMGRSVAAEI